MQGRPSWSPCCRTRRVNRGDHKGRPYIILEARFSRCSDPFKLTEANDQPQILAVSDSAKPLAARVLVARTWGAAVEDAERFEARRGGRQESNASEIAGARSPVGVSRWRFKRTRCRYERT